MAQFLKFMFASMVGFLLAGLTIALILIGLVAAIVAGVESGSKPHLENGTVLHMKLDLPIPDRSDKNPFAAFDFASFSLDMPVGLTDVLKGLKRAAGDNQIKGVFLDISMIPAGLGTVDEIREAIIEFRQSGKFVVAYSELYTQRAYYLATAADKIYLNPEGFLDFRGLNASTAFFMGTLDKLDVDMQVIRGRGNTFKGAVEPFTRAGMSQENKEQVQDFIGSVWGTLVSNIAKARGLREDSLRHIADGLLIQQPSDAKALGLVDSLIYQDQLLLILRKHLGIGDQEKIKTITLAKYANVPDVDRQIVDKDKSVAVIFAEGDIQGGEKTNQAIGSEKVSRMIRQARVDSNIRAIVFRVNSGGGSALASEVIYREIKLAEAVKPVVISMGNYAASGGYWISCPADKIIAGPLTLTGSIGVFGLVPNLQGLMNNKLGITFDEVKTSEHADFSSVVRPLTDFERKVLQQSVDRIYDGFISRVSAGRNMSTSRVDSIAKGRIWSGADAVGVGLVDALGGLNSAIEEAVKLAGLETYRLVELPEAKDPFQQLMDNLTSKPEAKLQQQLGQYYTYYRCFESVKELKGVQARLPYFIHVE